jgi:CheY-like chemotaxis protein
VIDDEPMIAKAVQRTLANDHEVIAAGNGEEVLRRVRDGERFDVILCDLMMPHMTGMELHAELSKLSGDQADRMIFLTGGAFTTRARAFLDETPNQRIEKPFDTAHLRAMINERVNAQQPA